MASGRDLPPWERWPGVSIKLDTAGGRYWFDTEAADRAGDFFGTVLTHSKAPHNGKPFTLEPWESELIVRPLFGWKRADTGRRRFRKAYIEIPKKNGKTQLMAGIGNYVGFCDGEMGAEVVIAAADREQASLLFDAAKAMVEDAPVLAERAEVYRRAIVIPDTRTSIKVVSADVRSKHGPNIHCLIIDELHAQPDRELVETLSRGVAARLQPLIIYITTAGDDPDSICREEHDYAMNVIKGVFADETLLPVVFRAEEEDDWTDPAVWAKANPNLGVTVTRDFFETECRMARLEPRKQAAFKRLQLNIWTNQHTIWLDMGEWNACEAPYTGEKPAGVAMGLDLSAKLDLTAAAVVLKFRDEVRPAERLETTAEREDGETEKRTLNIDFRVEVFTFFWIPEDILRERAKEDRIQYDLWAKAGALRVTPGAVVDYDQIFNDIVTDIGPRFGLKRGEIGYDPYNGQQLALQLRDRKGYTVVEIPQNTRHLSEPAKLLEALIRSRRLIHDGNPVMRWNVSNVAVKEDKNGNIFPFKPRPKKRIDGVSAVIDGLSRLIVMKDRKPRRGARIWTPTGFKTLVETTGTEGEANETAQGAV